MGDFMRMIYEPTREQVELELFTGVNMQWKLNTYAYDPEFNGPIFMARDVAVALGYKKPADAISRHCKHPVLRQIVSTTGNRYKRFEVTKPMLFIGESDVFRLIMGSNLPSAEQFSDWVFEEVLPSLKNRGYYLTEGTIGKLVENPKARAALLATMSKKMDESEILAAKLEQVEKSISLKRDMEVSCKGYCTINTVAARLTSKYGITLGRTKLFALLRKMNILQYQKKNLPYRSFLDSGKMKVHPHIVPGTGEVVDVTLVSETYVDELIDRIAEFYESYNGEPIRYVDERLLSDGTAKRLLNEDRNNVQYDADGFMVLEETGDLTSVARKWYRDNNKPCPEYLKQNIIPDKI